MAGEICNVLYEHFGEKLTCYKEVWLNGKLVSTEIDAKWRLLPNWYKQFWWQIESYCCEETNKLIKNWRLTSPPLLGTVCLTHYGDVIMGTMVSQITSLTIVYSTVYLGADQRKHQSSTSLALVRGESSSHKWPVTRKMFPFDDVIMHFGLVTPSGIIQLHHSFRQWLTASSAPRHYLYYCWVIINWT